MALMNAHDMALRSRRVLDRFGCGLATPFWAIGAAFIAVYFALNLLTEWHEFDRLGGGWSPDDGLKSGAADLECRFCAVAFFLAAVLVDLSIAGLHRSLGVTMAAELSLTITYVGLAFVLKNALKLSVWRFLRFPDLVTILLVISPLGAWHSSFIYLWSAVS